MNALRAWGQRDLFEFTLSIVYRGDDASCIQDGIWRALTRWALRKHGRRVRGIEQPPTRWWMPD